MLKTGELVVYGAEGICEIIDINSQSFQGIKETRTYYILEPKENKSSRLFIPIDNEILCERIKKLLSYEEIVNLVKKSNFHAEWIADNKLRNKHYKDILSSYDRSRIIAYLKMIYYIKNGQNVEGKRLYTMDEDFYKKAIQILYTEFSYTLAISQEQILPYLCGEISCAKK